MAPKPWGWWTRHKLDILESYLQAFVTATKHKSSERIYLDLFAGWPENKSRETDEEILGSVHRALRVDPKFTRLALFELPRKAEKLRAALHREYGDIPELRIYGGDCNDTVATALQELRPVNWAPTFAFIDQFAAEIRWTTIEKLARFKRPGMPKVELWILFGTSFLPRGLQLNQPLMDAKFGDRISDMYGTNEWSDIVHARRKGLLSAEEVADELVNLMRWRLETVLGYRRTHAFTMKNTQGQNLYHMIFVTDHEVGDKIMRQVYGKALSEHENMRQHALTMSRLTRREADGQGAMFAIEPSQLALSQVPDDRIYVPEPPREPYRLPRQV